MQPEEPALFPGFHPQPRFPAKRARFPRAVDVDVAVTRQIDQRHFHTVDDPPHKRRLRRHVPEDQSAARPEHSVNAGKEIPHIRIVLLAHPVYTGVVRPIDLRRFGKRFDRKRFVPRVSHCAVASSPLIDESHCDAFPASMHRPPIIHRLPTLIHAVAGAFVTP